MIQKAMRRLVPIGSPSLPPGAIFPSNNYKTILPGKNIHVPLILPRPGSYGNRSRKEGHRSCMRNGTRPIWLFPPPAGRMIRRSWIFATALCLAVVMAVLGSVSRDAMSAILSSMPAKGVPAVEGEGAPKFLPA